MWSKRPRPPTRTSASLKPRAAASSCESRGDARRPVVVLHLESCFLFLFSRVYARPTPGWGGRRILAFQLLGGSGQRERVSICVYRRVCFLSRAVTRWPSRTTSTEPSSSRSSPSPRRRASRRPRPSARTAPRRSASWSTSRAASASPSSRARCSSRSQQQCSRRGQSSDECVSCRVGCVLQASRHLMRGGERREVRGERDGLWLELRDGACRVSRMCSLILSFGGSEPRRDIAPR